MRKCLPLLASLKWLRGKPIDPFGHTEERRAERAMIADYHAMLDEQLPRLTAERLATVTILAELPDAVRGFGPIKEKAIEEMRERRAALLDELGRQRTAP